MVLKVRAFSGSAAWRSSGRGRGRRARREQAEQARVLEPLPGVMSAGGACGGSSPSRAMPRSRAVRARWAGGVASHITVDHDDDLDQHRDQALPQEDGVRQADDAVGHHALVGDDVADARLERARSGHLQRRRAAQPLGPDAAEPQDAGGAERAVVHVGMRRATSRASTALKTRLKPQLNQEPTARTASPGHRRARRRRHAGQPAISRPIGGVLATT